MAIDIYSLCPGGSGKKIKFCCSDFLGELQKIDRMLEGEQYVGCLSHIQQLESQRSDRACLMAIKGMLLRSLDKLDEAAANAERFVELHPDNPTALAEMAIVTSALQGGKAAVPGLQKAIAASADGFQNRLIDALSVVGNSLLVEGYWQACRAIWQLLLVLTHDKYTMNFLVELALADDVPILFKEDPKLPEAPEDAPWKAELQEIKGIAYKTAQWAKAADRLSALAGQYPREPILWRFLAILRGWLADAAGSAEAFRKYAALDVPADDAVEAEAAAMLLSDDPFGDLTDVLTATWTVRDPERLRIQLTSDNRVWRVNFNPSDYADEDNPPPLEVLLLLDRPRLDSADNLSWEIVPCVMGQVMLFGRQTDREARLEIGQVRAADMPRVKAALAEIAGDAMDPQPVETNEGRASETYDMLERKWVLPPGVTSPRIESITLDYLRHAVLESWPQLKLGALDGKTPREAAAEPAFRVRLEAAVMLLQLHNASMGRADCCDQLLRDLSLPESAPIDPRQTPVAELPLARLRRVAIEHCSDEDLLSIYNHAVSYNIIEVMRKSALAIIERPSMASREERLRSYQLLARITTDYDRAVEYLDAGRKEAEAQGESSGLWDVLELSVQFRRADGQAVARLIQHIQRQHIEEPGVSEIFTRLLMQYGLIRPDGTPVGPRRRTAATAPAVDASDAAPSKLWTPEDQQPAGKSKLWVP
jgi:hypothetical protein